MTMNSRLKITFKKKKINTKMKDKAEGRLKKNTKKFREQEIF